MKNFEQELKLQLDEREFSLLGCLAYSKPQLQTNYYFTMQNMSSEVMVRLREKGVRGQEKKAGFSVALGRKEVRKEAGNNTCKAFGVPRHRGRETEGRTDYRQHICD